MVIFSLTYSVIELSSSCVQLCSKISTNRPVSFTLDSRSFWSWVVGPSCLTVGLTKIGEIVASLSLEKC